MRNESFGIKFKQSHIGGEVGFLTTVNVWMYGSTLQATRTSNSLHFWKARLILKILRAINQEMVDRTRVCKNPSLWKIQLIKLFLKDMVTHGS